MQKTASATERIILRIEDLDSAVARRREIAARQDAAIRALQATRALDRNHIVPEVEMGRARRVALALTSILGRIETYRTTRSVTAPYRPDEIPLIQAHLAAAIDELRDFILDTTGVE